MPNENQVAPLNLALVARQHFVLFQEADRAKKVYDFKKCLGHIAEYEDKAKILIESGWSEYEVGANALGLHVRHFRELVKEGIYQLGIGMPYRPDVPSEKPQQERQR